MFLSLVLLGLCICFIILQLRPRRPKNFPPGPPVLPILGNILHLNLQNPLEDLEKLRKSYGDVYSLFLGPKPNVVINGVKAMKEAMVIKAAEFAGQPQDTFLQDVFSEKGVILADYSTSWREHRRFALMTLRNFVLQGRSCHRYMHRCSCSGKQLIDSVNGVLFSCAMLCHKLVCVVSFTGKTLCPQVMFHNVAFNIICQVLFGTRYEYDDEFITTIIQCVTEITKITNGPWAMLYDTRSSELVLRLLNEHKKTRVPGEPRDFLDCYLDEMEKKAEDSSFSEDKLIFTALDLLFAGTDTTSNTLLTAFLYLMNHPHIQEQCQQEIDRVLEGKDQACFDDRHQMPYIQAVIHESQRIANTVPLSVFHSTTKDSELMGYSIPKGTMIIQNLSSVLNEEGQWKYPHEFNPENFLNDQGEFVKPDAFMPFSTGPRMCLGEGLARMELFLIMVTLLRKFKFIWPEDAGEPDYTPVFGGTVTPKPYPMKVQHRL
uniref:Cytochrome P450, family 2, subfamily X, polypeptide 9 n=1 Tax=Amphiprion percula TaxID=161767 RepID=A0A3P8U6T3_AMPPE